MQNKTIDAVILAGQRKGEANPFHKYDVEHKAFIDMAGEPMIKRVVDTVLRTGRFETLTIVVPQHLSIDFEALFVDYSQVTVIQSQASPSMSIRQFLETALPGKGVFVTSCDHPLMSVEMITHFLGHIENRDVDVAAACVSRETFEASYPEAKRTFIKLSDLQFSGANMFWFKAGKSDGLLAFWRRLEENRKRPLKMASEIGIFTALKYLTGFLSKTNLIHSLFSKTGVRGDLIELPFAKAAIDVDKPEDVILVRSVLSNPL